MTTITNATALINTLTRKIAGVESVAGIDLAREMGIEYRIDHFDDKVQISALYSEDREYEDQPWKIMGALPDFDRSYLTNDDHGTVIHTLEFDVSEAPETQIVFGSARKNQDKTKAAAKKLGVNVNSLVHSPKMSVGGHGFSYAVYDLVDDDRVMVESFVNSESRHARRYAAVLVDRFEPSVKETAYRDANEIYRATDELGIGFEDLVNSQNA